jgi:hypothetical protein
MNILDYMFTEHRYNTFIRCGYHYGTGCEECQKIATKVFDDNEVHTWIAT